MRVFMVNKNKGWQAGRLLHRNAPSSHLHRFVFFFFFCVCLSAIQPFDTLRQRRIVTLTHVNHPLGDHDSVWQHVKYAVCVCV